MNSLPGDVSALVIGYGNDLRGDDAAGWRAAEGIEALHLPQVETILSRQLTPDLAASLSGAPVAVFVDACVDPELDGVRVRRVHPSVGRGDSSHHAAPEDLLWLAAALYHASPRVWAIDIPASEFEFGAGLSQRTSAAVEVAIARIRDIVTRAQ